MSSAKSGSVTKSPAAPVAKTSQPAAAKPPVRASAKSVKHALVTPLAPVVEKSKKRAISSASAGQQAPGNPTTSTPISVKPAKPDMTLKKVPDVQPKSTQAELLAAADALLKGSVPVKKKPGRPPKAAAAEGSPAVAAVAKPVRKLSAAGLSGDEDLSDIEAEFAEEPAAVEATAATEKVKPLRMKISKAKERALMKEFGLDETILSEEDILKRRLRLKTLIKLGKTRGYLTHGEISDHLPDKLVDAETLEVVINMLNDMGVAVFEQAPDAETLLLNNTGATVATEEEAEEEAEAALSTVDSEFGRTTDPVRMYMREMARLSC